MPGSKTESIITGSGTFIMEKWCTKIGIFKFKRLKRLKKKEILVYGKYVFFDFNSAHYFFYLAIRLRCKFV